LLVVAFPLRIRLFDGQQIRRYGERNTMDKKVLIGRERIRKRVREIGREISEDYAGKEPVLIGILNGVVFFFVELVMAMSIPLKMDFIKASSYGTSMTSSGQVRMLKDVCIPVKDRDLILIDDIVDTGLTLKCILENLRAREPASIRICALIDRKERREQSIDLDYCGFKVDQGFLVGYGLDFNEQYRYLPDIWVVE
jgi:hypoxanthine phosphoribosyltransferase